MVPLYDTTYSSAFLPDLELLVWRGGDYRPSEIMFTGYACMAFNRMIQFGANFNFTCDQMEQMGAVLAMANVCKQADEPGTESMVFALLEGNPMYVDVLMQQLYWTAPITSEGDDDDEPEGFYVCNSMYTEYDPMKLTPDQTSPELFYFSAWSQNITSQKQCGQLCQSPSFIISWFNGCCDWQQGRCTEPRMGWI